MSVFVICELTTTLYAGGGGSDLPDEVIPYKSDEALPPRTQPIIELGDPFLSTGNLYPGFRLPTGAIIQPRFWVYGTFRSAIQSYDRGQRPKVNEWLSRLDLFGNLQLTGTERILVGIQPLNRGNEFTGWISDTDEEFKNRTNLRVRTLFFEGDFGELFPRLDNNDQKALDYGFSIGRQQIFFQDGLLINDTIDAIGITRNSKRFVGVPWITNVRVTGLWGWNEINRDDNIEDNNAKLCGLFSAIDTWPSTVEIDGVYVDSNDDEAADLWAWGIGSTQRIGKYNTTFRYNGSAAADRKTPQSDDGHLFFGEFSWTPYYTHNLTYINAFWGIDNFSSAARDPSAGGPLGRTGILFASRNISSFPAPLSSRADEAFGLALGYQMFFNNNRQQVIVEAGGRTDDTRQGFDAIGIATRFQTAIFERYVLQFDAFATDQESRDDAFGIRSEFTVKF